MRLDLELVRRNLYNTRARAAAAIVDGLVFVNGVPAIKNSMNVDADDEITARSLPFESGRGALKLVHALDVFGVDVRGLTALDVGASTGGFTEVLLNRGAARIIAVDVGHDQMIAELRNDPRVELFEDTDIRTMPPRAVDLIVIDVSFIRLTDIMDAIKKWNAPKIIALIKPQFELPSAISAVARGVIKSDADRRMALEIAITAFESVGYKKIGVIKSPIRGGSGNVEYLGYFSIEI